MGKDRFEKVFDRLGYEGEERAVLLARFKLLSAVKETIERKGWSGAEAADKLEVKPPRISEIMALRIDKFSVELLLRYLDRLGEKVAIDV